MATTLAYYAAFVALGLVAASLGPTLPDLARQTGTVLAEVSFLFTTRSTGYLIGSFIGGRLYDRLPGHRVMGGMLAVMVVCMFLVPLTPVIWLLAAILLALGLGEGAVDVGGNALIVWVHGRKVGPFMNALHFFFGFGAFLSPIIIAQLVLRSGGITAAYWALGLLVVPVVFWLFRLRSPTHHEAAAYSGGQKEINYVLTGLVALFMLLYVGAEVSFGGWIFTYAVTLGLTSATAAAYLTSVFWGSLTVGRLLAIPIAMRFRPRTILLVDLLGCIASVGLILLLPGSAAAVWVGAAGLGLFMASIFPTTIIWAGRRMTLSGAITSWFLIGSSLGAMTFPLLIGQLFESQGPQVVMVVIEGVLLAATGLFVGLMLYAGRPTAEEV